MNFFKYLLSGVVDNTQSPSFNQSPSNTYNPTPAIGILLLIFIAILGLLLFFICLFSNVKKKYKIALCITDIISTAIIICGTLWLYYH